MVYKFVDKNEQGQFTLYHATPIESLEIILDEGLRGGYNTIGGNRGIFMTPTLFLAQEKWVAEKYARNGVIIHIFLTKEELDTFDQINDGLGDTCFLKEGEGILVDADKIWCPWFDHQEGICDEDCEFCEDD